MTNETEPKGNNPPRADSGVNAAATADATDEGAERNPALKPRPDFAAKASDLEALRDAVADAASVAGGLWLSYIFTFFYLAIAAGSVTHRDLFFERPVKLPFLNVDLPLVGFFTLAPAIFIAVHTYLLLHLVLLATKVGAFAIELHSQVGDDSQRERLRGQLPSSIFVQLLAGPRELQHGLIGLTLGLIALSSLCVGPLGLLIFFQLQFLPYQDDAVVWWQRIIVIADVGLLWILWPTFWRGNQAPSSNVKNGTFILLSCVSLTAVIFAFAIATFPGEWLEDRIPTIDIIPLRDANGGQWHFISPHKFLVAGDVDLRTRRPVSLWSNRLVLPGIDVLDRSKFDTEAKTMDATETLSLRARHLQGAVLIDANLRKVDFTAAKLQGALLTDSDLRGANFGCTRAQLQTKDFECTHLEGAVLVGAHLENANLVGAQLAAASLTVAHLQGASLAGANLLGAYLGGAYLQATTLDNADLRGAVLSEADLSESSFEGTQLQGAVLSDAKIQYSSFLRAFVWRADILGVSAKDTIVSAPETGPKDVCGNTTAKEKCTFVVYSPETFHSLMRRLAEDVPAGELRVNALQRIMQRLNPETPLNEEKRITAAWIGFERSSPAKTVFEKGLMSQLRATACAVEGAPYPLLGVLDRLWEYTIDEPQLSPAKLALIDSLLDEKHCPGAQGLSAAKRGELRQIREQSVGAIPNQMAKRQR
ncbi:pentapeptide repeat-containing protein [Paraburkholderia sp. GAS32]|uniref:pentapeptide repeat-containing protein n=1 Tax=Paraburkholderia sp. GAS32 TaxID=3035129 RepID=UPI003D24B74C